ncbi:hypothetical protein [Ralstonia pseudosolanacearum]
MTGDYHRGCPATVLPDLPELSATMHGAPLRASPIEITFIFPDDTDGATARFRIFTPDYEMPFAGPPI